MPDMNVINKDGDWYVNRALFRFVYAPEGQEAVAFESGMPTKVKVDADFKKWIESQPLIVSCPDPMSSDEPIPSKIDSSENTVVPNDDVTGKPDASAAPGIAQATKKK